MAEEFQPSPSKSDYAEEIKRAIESGKVCLPRPSPEVLQEYLRAFESSPALPYAWPSETERLRGQSYRHAFWPDQSPTSPSADDFSRQLEAAIEPLRTSLVEAWQAIESALPSLQEALQSLLSGLASAIEQQPDSPSEKDSEPEA